MIFPLESSPAHRGKVLVAEDLLQVFQLKRRRHTEHAISIKAAVRAQNMEVRMLSKEIAKRMYGDNGPWNRFLLLDGFLEKFLQGFPVPPSAGLSSESNFRS